MNLKENNNLLHVQRFHSEDFDCRLCDAFFKNQDDLETHLPSCEHFKCRECNKTWKRKNERTHSTESCT